jgi:glucosamine--fructose-6-phosphate aminotransferase (isomerizing)
MLNEIHDQPRALRQTFAGRIDEVNAAVELELHFPASYLDALEQVQIVAVGTSYHAGLFARHLLAEHADVRVTVEVASEYDFDGGRDPWNPLVSAVTHSGETSAPLSAIRKAARAGAWTLAL